MTSFVPMYLPAQGFQQAPSMHQMQAMQPVFVQVVAPQAHFGAEQQLQYQSVPMQQLQYQPVQLQTFAPQMQQVQVMVPQASTLSGSSTSDSSSKADARPQAAKPRAKPLRESQKKKAKPVPPPVTADIPQPDMPVATELPAGYSRERKFLATVVRIGEVPLLHVKGAGNYPFAYRNVKKRKGDNRTLITVGNMVECKLTESQPLKAISVKILSGSGVPLEKGRPTKEKSAKAQREQSQDEQMGSNVSGSSQLESSDTRSDLSDDAPPLGEDPDWFESLVGLEEE